VLNQRGRTVVVHDIDRAVRLSKRVGWLALGVCVAARRIAKGRTS
jgi:adenosylcobinamide-phosphate synthase